MHRKQIIDVQYSDATIIQGRCDEMIYRGTATVHDIRCDSFMQNVFSTKLCFHGETSKSD